MRARVVVIDDDVAMCEFLETTLVALDLAVTWYTDPVEALAHVRREVVDVVLTDVRMRGMSGLDLCRALREARPLVPVIVLTGFGSMDLAVEAIRAGAYDFLSKPVELDALELAVQRALSHRALTHELNDLREKIASVNPGGIIGRSAAFQRVLDLLPRAARADVPVLLQGETGTGKELFAQAIHAASARAQRPFVAVNCAAIPATLVESELFGHVRGAFTDAHGDRKGLFLEAGHGTLFLDEVGELPAAVQPKLLRALQEGRIRPVGADTERPVHCRVVAATNRDLKQDADRGTFRADLYYRLAVIRVLVPPLRERAGDILELAQFFLRRAAMRLGSQAEGLSTETARVLLHHDWPGNVRELENAVERAVAMSDGPLLSPEDLPEDVVQAGQSPFMAAVASDEILPLADLEARHIRRALVATHGNKKAAAELLGVDRRTLYRKLERLDEG